MQTVNKLTPAFSNLTSATISYGTANTTISGNITAAATGTVSITINGNTQPVFISAGSFSVSFPTGTIPQSATPYTITYAYQGDSNYNTLSDASKTLTVNKATPVFSNLTSATIAYGPPTRRFRVTLRRRPRGP